MKSSFNDLTLRSLVVVPGEQRVPTEEDMGALGFEPEQMKRMKETLGLGSRAVAAPGTTATDLCFQAARQLLERESAPPDVLLMVTQTPDFEQPGSGHVLHRRLQLPDHCAVIDLTMGCSGFVYALWMAMSLIQGGGAGRVLLCCGDTVSRRVQPQDKTTRLLFGDAGAAALVEKRPDVGRSSFVLKADGRGAEHLWIPGGAARHEASEAYPSHLVMNGAEIFNFSLKVGAELIPEVVSDNGWQLPEIDAFYLHQANHFILGNISKRLKVPANRVPVESFTRYGNLSSVSVPAALALHRLEQGTEFPRQVVLAGFGVGLSWAAAALTLPEDFRAEILA